jgi:hypothetical protein
LGLVGCDPIGLGDVDPILRLLDQMLEQPEVSHRDQRGQRLARATDDHPLPTIVHPVHQLGDVAPDVAQLEDRGWARAARVIGMRHGRRLGQIALLVQLVRAAMDLDRDTAERWADLLMLSPTSVLHVPRILSA